MKSQRAIFAIHHDWPEGALPSMAKPIIRMKARETP